MSALVPFIVFFLVANPKTFQGVRSIAGNWVASQNGAPTQAGVLLHALVFVLIMRLVWSMKSSYGPHHIGKRIHKDRKDRNRPHLVMA